MDLREVRKMNAAVRRAERAERYGRKTDTYRRERAERQMRRAVIAILREDEDGTQ